jgi:hypothetical protein
MLGEKRGGGEKKKEKSPNKIMDREAKSLKLGAITGETEQQEEKSRIRALPSVSVGSLSSSLRQAIGTLT